MAKKYSHSNKHLPIAFGISAIIFIVYLWQFSPEQRFTLFFINKALAATAVSLISLSYFMGPLVKMIPFLRFQLLLRKYFGILGFFAVLLHIVTSLLQFTNRIPFKWYVDHVWGLLAAIVASLIFLGLYWVSNDHAYVQLGQTKWKSIQRLGYIALLFTLLHIWFAASPRWQMYLRGEVDMPLSLKMFVTILAVMVIRLLWIGVDVLFPKSKRK